MKILVAYYSRTGNTEKVALTLIKSLHCDSERIIDVKKRSGIFGWIFGGRDGMEKNMTGITSVQHDPASYDLVILGTPIWVNCTPAMRTYIHLYDKKFKKVAFFCTMGSSDPSKLFSEMETLCGKKPMATFALTTAAVKANAYASVLQAFCKKL